MITTPPRLLLPSAAFRDISLVDLECLASRSVDGYLLFNTEVHSGFGDFLQFSFGVVELKNLYFDFDGYLLFDTQVHSGFGDFLQSSFDVGELNELDFHCGVICILCNEGSV